jgi:hypothetical protein
MSLLRLRLRLRVRHWTGTTRSWWQRPAKLVHEARSRGHHHSSSLWTSRHHHSTPSIHVAVWRHHLWRGGIAGMHHRRLRGHHRHHVGIHRVGVGMGMGWHGIGRHLMRMHRMWRHHHLWMHHRVHLLVERMQGRRRWTPAQSTAQSSRHGRLGRRHQLRLGLHGRPLLPPRRIVVVLIRLHRMANAGRSPPRRLRLLRLISGHLGGHGPVVQIDSVDNDRHEGRWLLVMVPVGRVGRVGEVPLVMMMLVIAVPMLVVVVVVVVVVALASVGIVVVLLFGIVAAAFVLLVVAVVVLGAASCGLVLVVVVVVVPPPSIPLRSCIGTGCIVSCHGFLDDCGVLVLPARSMALLRQVDRVSVSLCRSVFGGVADVPLFCKRKSEPDGEIEEDHRNGGDESSLLVRQGLLRNSAAIISNSR